MSLRAIQSSLQRVLSRIFKYWSYTTLFSHKEIALALFRFSPIFLVQRRILNCDISMNVCMSIFYGRKVNENLINNATKCFKTRLLISSVNNVRKMTNTKTKRSLIICILKAILRNFKK